MSTQHTHSIVLWIDRRSNIIAKLGDFGIPSKLGMAGVVLKIWAIEICSIIIVRHLMAQQGVA